MPATNSDHPALVGVIERDDYPHDCEREQDVGCVKLFFHMLALCDLSNNHSRFNPSSLYLRLRVA